MANDKDKNPPDTSKETGISEVQYNKIVERLEAAEKRATEAEELYVIKEKAFVELAKDLADRYEKSLREVTEKYEALNRKVNGHSILLKSAGDAINSLKTATPDTKAELKKEEPLELPTSPFEVDGVKYKFTHKKFMWGTVSITAKAAMEDDELLRAIVTKTGKDADIPGAGIIQTVK